MVTYNLSIQLAPEFDLSWGEKFSNWYHYFLYRTEDLKVDASEQMQFHERLGESCPKWTFSPVSPL